MAQKSDESPGKGDGSLLKATRAEHIGMRVRDMDRSVRFYTEVLGLPLRARHRPNDQVEIAFIGVQGCELELICRAGDFPYATESVVNHFALRVEDVDGVAEQLKARGVAIVDGPRDVPFLGARVAFFAGPDGESLELFASK